MMNVRRVSVFVGLASLVALSAPGTLRGASVMVGYSSVNGAAVSPVIEAAGVSGADLVRGAGIVENTGGTFNSRGFDQADAASALTGGDYLEWGFASVAGVDLDSLSLRYDRSGTGPAQVEIFLSTNGGAFVSVFSDADVDDGGEDVDGIDLSGFDGVNNAIFRLAGWDASSTGGTFDIEDSGAFVSGESLGIVVFGTVLPVDGGGGSIIPEPGRALLGFGGLAAGLLVRRRPRGAAGLADGGLRA